MPNIMGKTFPAEVAARIKELGYRVRLARTRRGMSIAEVAAKAGINRNTLNALELGKPGVAIGVYVIVLWALGLDSTLDGIAHPDADTHGKTLEASRRPARVRKSQKSKHEYDF
jgi:transcriptional regulator with XRE-family HTH domain